MHFYLITYLTLLVLSYIDVFRDDLKNSYTTEVLMILVIIIFAIFSGIRYRIGNDFIPYLNIFKDVESVYLPPYKNIETGFKVVIVFFKSLNFPPYSLFLIFSVFLLCFVYRGISKNSQYKLFSLFLYFSIFYITYLFNVLRQGVAMAIFIYLLPDFKERNFSKVAVFTLIAASIHNSGIFIFISYFIYKFSFKRNFFIISTVLSIIYFFNNKILMDYFLIYTPDFLSDKLSTFIMKFGESVDLTSFLLRLIILTILIYYYNEISKLNGIKGIFNIYFFGFLVYVLFSFQGEFATRINMFFRILEVILLPSVLIAEKNKIIRYLAFLLIIAIASAIFYVTLRNPHNYPFNYFWVSS